MCSLTQEDIADIIKKSVESCSVLLQGSYEERKQQLRKLRRKDMKKESGCLEIKNAEDVDSFVKQDIGYGEG